MTTRQRGQALPLGLAMILVGVLGALVLYNTGSAATDKARLANAADAAAYSGLLWQARALNFQAYTNRAMIANQVSIAQGVSLSSWMSYASTTADNLERVLGALPFVGPLTSGMARALNALDGVIQPIAAAMVETLDTITDGLSKSQQAMFASSFAATPEIVRDVIARSDAAGRFTADSAYGLGGLHENLTAWNDFTERHDDTDLAAMDERAAVIATSRDEFTRQRDWKFFNEFWFYSSPIMRHRVFKSGSTRLIAVDDANGRRRWEWKAKDTVALQNRRLKFTGKEKKSELPIGWGESYANENGGKSLLTSGCERRRYGLGRSDGPPLPCGTWGKNKAAERNGARAATAMNGYHGLKAFRTVSAALLAGGDGERPTLDAEPLLRLKVEASMGASDAYSSADSIGGETFGVGIEAAGSRLSSISVAEVYYRRPDERTVARTAREAANGYNPYWDVRLAPISDEERLLAAGLRVAAAGEAPGGGSVPMTNGASAVEGRLDDEVGARVDGALDGLAGIYAGSEAAAVRERFDRYAAMSVADIEGFAAEVGADVVDDIETVLVRELERAPQRILARVDGGIGAIEKMRDTLNDIEESDIAADVKAARAISDRMEAVAEVVATALGDYIEELLVTRVAEIEPDVVRMRELSERLETAGEEERAALQAELERLGDVRDAALELLRDDIALHLIEVTAEHVPEWPLPLDVAYHTVDSFLEDFRGQLETDDIDVIEWVFTDDEEEDSDPDPTEGDDHGNY